LSTPDSRIARILPRLRRLAHALVCEADKADELVKALAEQVADGSGPDPEDELAWIRLLRRLWINRREEWQPALPLDVTRDIDKAMQAMAKLPRNQREVVALVVVDGLGYRDAANIAGVSVVTLSERLLSGRSTLASLLAETTA
jgi:RNA polymerase sigma-70 factor (ECF subfamily)